MEGTDNKVDAELVAELHRLVEEQLAVNNVPSTAASLYGSVALPDELSLVDEKDILKDMREAHLKISAIKLRCPVRRLMMKYGTPEEGWKLYIPRYPEAEQKNLPFYVRVSSLVDRPTIINDEVFGVTKEMKWPVV